jgi:transcriptional regulator with XRE-family HTH domain
MNREEHLDVGGRIRELRKTEGLSLRALADRSDLSINAISRIERGESSPTVSSLLRLATAFGVHITDLFETGPEQATILVRRNKRLRSRGDGVLMESLGIGLPGQILEPFLMTIEAGAVGMEEPCEHTGEEFVHCIEGEIEYQVADEWHRLEAGDSLLFLAKQPHMCRNTSLNRALILLILASSDQETSLSQQQHLMTIGGQPAEREE